MEITAPDGKNYKQPFRMVTVPTDVTELTRTTEEKLYVVLYYNIEYEEYKFAKFYGRYNTYFGIRDILEAESVDLHASEVLVETVGIDPKTNKARRYLIHPEEASDLMDFCHQMEPYFGDNAYSVDQYDTGYTIKEVSDYMDQHPEPNEVDYRRVNAMLNGRHQTDLKTDNVEEATASALGINKDFLKNAMGAAPVFMDEAQQKENGKQFFTPANMGDVQSKEI